MTVVINGNTGISGTNGSAGTPAVQGEDTNTGIFFPAADTVAVATAGAERVRVTSAGDVGVGTASPAEKLSVAGAIRTHTASSAGFTLDAKGGLFDFVPGSVNVRLGYVPGTSGDNSGVLTFLTGSGAECARIDAGGNLLVGTTNGGLGATNGVVIGPSESAWTTGTPAVVPIRIYNKGGAGARYLMEFRNSSNAVGAITHNGSSTTYATSSDYRLKENVAPMQNALDTVAQLNPVTYTWKADGSAGQGFIAHELQAVVPDCVTGEKDAVDAEGNPQYQGVDTSFLVATLVKAIQELTARIAILEAK